MSGRIKSRTTMNSNEPVASNYILINGYYYFPPPKQATGIKELLHFVRYSGAGKKANDSKDIPEPWSISSLADALSQLSPGQSVVGDRAVHQWTGKNERAISDQNITILAKLLGCERKEETLAWRNALIEANNRSKQERASQTTSKPNQTIHPPSHSANQTLAVPQNLATRIERLFTVGAPTNLPILAMSGSVVLCLSSYFLQINDIELPSANEPPKQIGFMWSPNWTILFLFCMPLALLYISSVVGYWKHRGRAKLLSSGGPNSETHDNWLHHVSGSVLTQWSILLICVFVIFIFQWISVRLMPLFVPTEQYSVDWGRYAVVDPQTISVAETIVFTAVAYAYMSFCFFLLFSGLVLLTSLVHDVSKFAPEKIDSNAEYFSSTANKIQCGIHFVALYGILIAIMMKLQSYYLVSSSSNYLAMLYDDIASMLGHANKPAFKDNFVMPKQYTSLIVALSSCIPFVFSMLKLPTNRVHRKNALIMFCNVTVLFASYSTIGSFGGYSILLLVAALVALTATFSSIRNSR